MAQHSQADEATIAKRTARIRSFQTLGIMSAPFVFRWMGDLPLKTAFLASTVVFFANWLVAYLLLVDVKPRGERRPRGSLLPRLGRAIKSHFVSLRVSMRNSLAHPMLASWCVLGFFRPGRFLGIYTIRRCAARFRRATSLRWCSRVLCVPVGC